MRQEPIIGDAPKLAKGLTEDQSKLLDRVLAATPEVWVEKVRRHWAKSAPEKLELFETDRARGRDFLSLTIPALRSKAAALEKSSDEILLNVRRKEYSISDLYVELTNLHRTLVEVVDTQAEASREDREALKDCFSSRFRALFLRILNETSVIYEEVLESGGRAFCQVDSEGVIVYANDQMNGLLGVDDTRGRCLADFFGDEGRYVSEALQGRRGPKPGTRRLRVRRPDGSEAAVYAEIAPVHSESGRHRGYAHLTDISAWVEAEQDIFERLPVGIFRVDRRLNVTYANRQALRITGARAPGEISVSSLPVDEKNRKLVQERFSRRLQGESDEYKVEIQRLDTGRRQRVNIAAAPDIDSEGEVIGSLAILRDVELELTADSIHRHIETERTPEELFGKIKDELSRNLDFDFLSVTIYSRNSTHARVEVFLPRDESVPFFTRWFPISAPLLAWLGQPPEVKYEGDFESFLQLPEMEELRDDPTVQGFLSYGIKSFISYPVSRKGRLVATVSLSSTQPDAFEGFEKTFSKLPLDRAVQMMLFYLEADHRRFQVETIQKVLAARDLRAVADSLVKSLVDYYGWQNVAVFRVNRRQCRFELFSQASKEGAWSLPEDYEQDIERGILGFVYREGVPVNIGDTERDPDFKDIHVRLSERTTSELCLPVVLGGEIHWLLNVEDERRNAFSEDELVELEGFVRQLTESIEAISFERHILRGIAEGASDGVIITDESGTILEWNPAAGSLLGVGEKGEPRSLAEFFQDADLGRSIAGRPEFRGGITLLDAELQPVDVFLTSFELPDEFARRVFLLHDLSLTRRLEELEGLREMFGEIATQMRTPLALAVGWLERLMGSLDSSETVETLQKTIRQLRKVELTYDRLALYDSERGAIPYSPILLDAGKLIERTIGELPGSDRKKVSLEWESGSFLLRADPFQLTFVVKTILSHLLRFCPLDKPVSVHGRTAGEWFELRIEGELPALPVAEKGGLADSEMIARTRASLALGEPIVERFLKQHGGQYQREEGAGNATEFVLRLPLTS